MNDNLIIDNFYIEYEMYEANIGWIRHCVYARSMDYDRTDAHMLTVITASGKTLYLNPVRNIQVQDCRRSSEPDGSPLGTRYPLGPDDDM